MMLYQEMWKYIEYSGDLKYGAFAVDDAPRYVGSEEQLVRFAFAYATSCMSCLAAIHKATGNFILDYSINELRETAAGHRPATFKQGILACVCQFIAQNHFGIGSDMDFPTVNWNMNF